MSRRLTVVNNRIVVSSMEARAAMADYDAATGRWTLYANTQGGWLVKNLIGPVFGTDPEKFRVITPDVGGGFGMKLFLYAEHVLTCYAARKLGRPVKWASERSEAFLSDTQGRDNITLGELAIDADGKFLALRTRNISNMGAYLSNFAPFIPTFAGTSVLASVYGFQAIYANVLGVFTNTVPVDAYRGAGRPESQLPGRAADRRRGARTEDRPRRAAPAQHGAAERDAAHDAGRQDLRQRRFPQGARRRAGARWTTPASRHGAPRRRSAASGAASGFAYYLEATGGDPTERAEIRFADDGFVDVYVGTQSTGQGHETAYVQLTATRLGIDGEKIRIRQGDTDTIPVGGGTGGARSLYSEGQAILLTADTVIDKGKQAAARGAGGGAGRYRVCRGAVFDRRHRSRHRYPDAGGDAAAEGRGGRAGDHAGCGRGGEDRRPHLPQRLPHRRGRDRPGNRRGRAWCATPCATISARR